MISELDIAKMLENTAIYSVFMLWVVGRGGGDHIYIYIYMNFWKILYDCSWVCLISIIWVLRPSHFVLGPEALQTPKHFPNPEPLNSNS